MITRSSNLPRPVVVALTFVLFAPQASLAQYVISTVAGGGPNHLAARSASIGHPRSLAFDPTGNAYIADSYTNRVLKVDTGGTVTVLAGNGASGYTGDGGLAISASLNAPKGVAVDGSGNVFIADTENSVIRKVTVSNGNITTMAGTGVAGYAGDGGPATNAQLNDPCGIFVDVAGNIFIADTANAVIREISNGTIRTVAGTPKMQGYAGDGAPATSAKLGLPEGVFVDGSGNIFIADTDNSVIRQVTIADGNIQTVAGAYYDYESNGNLCNYNGDGAVATNAGLCLPAGLFVDGSGNIFISDTYNQVIREVVATTGNIETVAGNNAAGAGYSGDGGAATNAQLNYPSDVVGDSFENMFVADLGNYVIREVTAGNIQTVSGNNTLSYAGDGGSAMNAELNFPGGVSVDTSRNLYISDSKNSVIREVSVTSGYIQTVAGNGIACSSSTALCGDGALAVNAQFNNPYGLSLDASGNIFIADTKDNRIRVVNTGNQAITIAGNLIQPGNVATVAGSGTAGYSGDGAAATNAELFNPYGVFVDSGGNIFIADTDNHSIREVMASGTIRTVAGNGTACAQTNAACGDGGIATNAQLNSPSNVFVDASENVFIADTLDNRIRVVNMGVQTITLAGVAIPPGNIATIAGTGAEGYAGDGGPAKSALLNSPYSVFVDSSGDIFIADTYNFVIREIASATGTIESVAGNNTPGFSGDGGQSSSAQLDSPLSLFGDSNGDLFVADTGSSRIRQLVPTASMTLTSSLNPSMIGQSVTFTATVTPCNGSASVGTITFTDGPNVLGTASLSNGQALLITSALSVGNHNIVASYAGNSACQTTASTALLQVVNLASATLSLNSDANPSSYNQAVKFIVALTPQTTRTVTGTVTFLDGANTLGTATVIGSFATIKVSVSALAVGTHLVTAAYSGDSNFVAANSGVLFQVVNKAVTLQSFQTLQNPSALGRAVMFKVTVTSPVGTPTGAVTLMKGATKLASSTLASGVASFSIANLPLGSTAITANYAGTANFAASSGSITQVVVSALPPCCCSSGNAIIQMSGENSLRQSDVSDGPEMSPILDEALKDNFDFESSLFRERIKCASSFYSLRSSGL